MSDLHQGHGKIQNREKVLMFPAWAPEPITDADIVIMNTSRGKVEINQLRQDILEKLENQIRDLQDAILTYSGREADISIRLKGGS
jgi:hypothetical protein